LLLAVVLLCGVGYWAWQRSTISRPAEPVPTPGGSAAAGGSHWLTDVTESVGLDFVHSVAHPDGFYMPDIMSSGGALFDFDCDGDLDIYLVNGAPNAPGLDRDPARSQGPAPVNRYFRQEPGGHFVDVTAESGLGDPGYGSGVAVGDVNNDGFPDVYVSNVGPDRLFLNQQDGSFIDITEAAGIENQRWGTSVAFVDYDRDGWLDIYVANYVDYHASRRCLINNGQEDFCHPGQFEPTSDKLYRNLGGSTASVADRRPVRFEDVSLESGIAARPRPGLGVLCADFNDDGWPDIYVANDTRSNFLWINDRQGGFRDMALVRGVATDAQGRPQSSMGIAVGDMDADRQFDLLLTHFSGEPNTLYFNAPPFGFEDRTAAAGLVTTTFNSTGFGVAMCDLDHDGDLDVAVANGHVMRPGHRTAAAGKLWDSYAEPNQLFLNDGRGSLELAIDPQCPFRSRAFVSRGLAAADVDGDGDLDLLVTNSAGPARLLYNEFPKSGNWIIIRAIEPALGGRDAYGAVVTATAGDKAWRQLVTSTTSYLTATDPRVHVGLGPVRQLDRIDVDWPDGSRESFDGGSVNRVIVLAHGQGRPR
jgi:hypothetical protein